jgi:hypothetical protein
MGLQLSLVEESKWPTGVIILSWIVLAATTIS